MEDFEKDALLYSFVEYANSSGGSGPKDILRPIIHKSICTLGKQTFTIDEIYDAIYSDFGKTIDSIIIRTELGRLQAIEEICYDSKTKKYTYLKTVNDYLDIYNNFKDSIKKFQRSLKSFIVENSDSY